MAVQPWPPPLPRLDPLELELLAGQAVAAGSLVAATREATPPAFAIVVTFPFVAAASAFSTVLATVAEPSIAAAP